MSNMMTSAGAFAGSCMAPEHSLREASEMVGSATSTVSSALFLSKHPICQAVAWVGVGVDGGNALVRVAQFAVEESKLSRKRSCAENENNNSLDAAAKRQRI
jgi:hypothetical protein